MEDPLKAEDSVLCDRCAVIRFNDKEFGGYEATDDSGNSILKFDEDDTERYLWLDCEHVDHLPDIPDLRSSAQAGCASFISFTQGWPC